MLQIEHGANPTPLPQLEPPPNSPAKRILQLEPGAIYCVCFRRHQRDTFAVAYGITPQCAWLFWAAKGGRDNTWDKCNMQVEKDSLWSESPEPELKFALRFVSPYVFTLEQVQRCHMDDNALLPGADVEADHDWVYVENLLLNLLWKDHDFTRVNGLLYDAYFIKMMIDKGDEVKGVWLYRGEIPENPAERKMYGDVFKYQPH